MAAPTTREEFKAYCLRKLGAPVIEINVDDDQVEDRIDEALSYWTDYHFDATEKIYARYQLTQTDIDNGWIPVPENVMGVVNIFPLSQALTGGSIFSATYQFVLNNLQNFVNYDMVNYYMSFQHLAFMQELLVGLPKIRYSRHRNQLFLDVSKEKLVVGQYIIYECYQVIDPVEFPNVWKDRWLQNYATEKIKYQWGSNLTKFNNMQLPGGVQFNGEMILRDAQEAIAKMEEQMLSSFSLPVSDLTG
jgi:hypothetical protein